jgi:hypothetical protein
MGLDSSQIFGWANGPNPWKGRRRRRYLDLKREEITGWRKLHNIEHNLYSSPKTVKVI